MRHPEVAEGGRGIHCSVRPNVDTHGRFSCPPPLEECPPGRDLNPRHRATQPSAVATAVGAHHERFREAETVATDLASSSLPRPRPGGRREREVRGCALGCVASKRRPAVQRRRKRAAPCVFVAGEGCVGRWHCSKKVLFFVTHCARVTGARRRHSPEFPRANARAFGGPGVDLQCAVRGD